MADEEQIARVARALCAADGQARGYRWSGGGDGRPKAWWTEVDEKDLAVEMRFLEREVYLRDVELRRDVLTAYERYRPE